MLSSLIFAALAVPLGVSGAPHASTAQSFRVLYAHQRATGSVPAKVTLKALTADLSAIIGQSSASSLVDGGFSSTPLAFDVDNQGAGTVSYDGKVYNIHTNTKISGGVVCSRMYDDSSFLVDCTIPWKGTSPPDSFAALAKRDVAAFRDDFGLAVLPVLPELTLHSRSVVETGHRAVNGTASIPDGSATPPECGHVYRHTERQGDGNPHQNYLHIQQSEVITCDGQNGCGLGVGQIRSRTVSWSVNVSPFNWISAEFDVSQTQETTNNYGCGGGPHDTVCAWYKMAHTAYTVDNWVSTQCDDRRDSVSIIKSPNRNNVGGGYYCVVNTCRWNNDQYWDDSGRAGGP